MKNPLIWIVVALVLGGVAFWLGGGDAQSAAPLTAANSFEKRADEPEPAELVEPATDDVESVVALTEEPMLAEVEAQAVEDREAIAAHDPVEVTGRVVDVATGAGVAGCWISLTSGVRAQAWRGSAFLYAEVEGSELGVLEQIETDAEGRFTIVLEYGELKGEASAFLATEDGWVGLNERYDLLPQEVLSGVELQFEVKRWPPPIAGNISGHLRTETGSFPEGAIPRTDHILLDLVSDALPAIEMRAVLELEQDDEGGVTFSFLFEDVPEGNYELTLSSLGNYRWSPTSMRVAPPAMNLEFLRFDLDGSVPLVFEVMDAETGDEITYFEARHIKQTNSAEHGVLLHTGPIESEQFPPHQAFVWSVEAPGYAVAYGNQSAFALSDGKRVTRVALRRGWSTRFLVMGGPEGSRPQPIGGASVHLDGKQVGHTDLNGALVARADQEPTQVEVRYLDWESPGVISTSKRRSNITPVIMTEPKRD